MIIDCISDLHGHYPKLEGGDLLIVAGDLTARDEPDQYLEFLSWLQNQNYEKKVFIAGNHDNLLIGPWPGNTKGPFREDKVFYDFDYLLDSGTEFESLKIWGSPWTKRFEGMNPKCMAFTVDTDDELAEKWALIPEDIDILVTHSPPSGFFDQVLHESKWGNHREYTGSISLRNHVMDRIRPELHVFGHIHECGGKAIDTCMTKFVNASHVNEYYKSANKAIRIEIEI